MTTALRAGLPPLPRRMAWLPLDHRGYPVPYFVQWFDENGVGTNRGFGKPDFRVTDSRAMLECVRERRCWLCGLPLGVFVAYNIGPMCAVNRVSGEPPSHRDCAVFAAEACPFLTRPKADRREAGLDDLQDRRGHGLITSPTAIARNPGVALVWITRDHLKIVRQKPSPLFDVGEPHEVLWFCEGRPATREEVLASIDSGMPLLEESCKQEQTPQYQAEALAELARQRTGIDHLLPV